ncbi:MAG: class I SAM-dependent methyltransferase [Candidatus Methylomirabilia bacterium]
MSRRGREFWTGRKVAWYQRALQRSDYAEKILGVLAPLLAVCETGLDVGAGCGALSLLLAERLRQVTAIEPAPAMARTLRDSARARGLRNIEVIEGAWGQVSVAPHDLVLCAHVGELLRPEAPFLREVSSAARLGVALVRDAGPERDKFFFRELYPLLLGRPYTPGCDYEETVEGLARLGTSPSVTLVSYRSDQPFDDLGEACDFWMEYLGVDGEHIREFLREFLEARLVREGAGWVAPYPKQAAVISWRVGVGSEIP